MKDGAPLFFLGCTMLCFGAINTYIGFSLLGERGLENRKRILESFRAVRDLSAKQRAEREPPPSAQKGDAT